MHYLTEDPGPRAVEHLASADEQLAIVELRALDQRHRDQGRSELPATRDAVTLIDEMIFVARPGVRSHVRIFAPAHRGTVVIMGELSDSPGPQVEPDVVVDALTTAYADLADDDTAWFRYLPLPDDPLPDDSVEFVRPGQPAEASSLGDLSAVLNGPVRRWHAADYTVATLTAAGVRTVLSSASGGGK
ncbi:MAG: hypothetical protein HOV83_12015 [Catenulispora sp.]|nr:hypothetical protein [Catenulispora sp.]